MQNQPGQYSGGGYGRGGWNAQLAEQQSSIYSRDSKENRQRLSAQRLAAKDKRTTVVREGGGTVWEDTSLLDWDPSHFRIFVGDLAGEISDDALLRAFSKYPTVQKAKNVRDKKSGKSKGFGFVSFRDPSDFVQALREMNGKYIGSRPVKLRKADSNINPSQITEEKYKQKEENAPYHKLLAASVGKSKVQKPSTTKSSRPRAQPLRQNKPLDMQ